jgi:ABC-2 type transport system ATP-binding protein
MIEVKNLTKRWGNFAALDGVSLAFDADERAIIMGQNGAGKTTLVRSILGEYIPSSGAVTIDGIDPFKEREKALASIGFVPQLPPPLRLSVSELIRYAVSSSGADRARLESACERLELNTKEQTNKLFYKLSGGMKQKLLIAIALARNPRIFIFDEPTANLDARGREGFYRLIDELGEGRTMLFISHRVEELRLLVNRKIEMELGKVINDQKI